MIKPKAIRKYRDCAKEVIRISDTIGFYDKGSAGCVFFVIRCRNDKKAVIKWLNNDY